MTRRWAVAVVLLAILAGGALLRWLLSGPRLQEPTGAGGQPRSMAGQTTRAVHSTEPCGHPLLPSRTGAWRRYRVLVGGRDRGNVELTLVEQHVAGQETITRWELRSSGGVTRSERWCSRSRGLEDPWSGGAPEGGAVERPAGLWRWPPSLREGAEVSGEARSRIAAFGSEGSLRARRDAVFHSRERVVVPAGAFDAWRAEGRETTTLGSADPVTTALTIWVAEEVGLVKLVRSGSGSPVEQELVALGDGG